MYQQVEAQSFIDGIIIIASGPAIYLEFDWALPETARVASAAPCFMLIGSHLYP